MGCGRQSLMKHEPNICELVFVPETDVFNACFNFWIIYQVGGVRSVLITNTTVTF